MKKRVLLISFSAITPERHHLMLRSLKQKGWETTFVGWDRTGGYKSRDNYEGAIDRLLWVRLPGPIWNWTLAVTLAKYYYRLIKLICTLGEQDIIILTHICLLPLTWIFKFPAIYDSFEMYSLQMAEHFGPFEKLARRFWFMAEGMLVKWVDGVMTVDSNQGWLERFFMATNKRVQVIYNFPAVSQDSDPDQTKAFEDAYRGRQVVAFVGGLDEQKGFRVALMAAALVKEKHPHCLFLFIGLMKDCAELIRDLIIRGQIEKNVLFLNQVNYKEMLSHIRHARAGLMLYHPVGHTLLCGPGNGRKSFTYMQAGIPIIGPAFGEVGEWIREEGCGILLDTTSVNEVAQAISHLLDHPDAARVMGQKGRAAFLEKYNWNSEEVKYLEFINKVTPPQ